MHVILDLHWLRPGQTGGSETVARGFLETLLRQGRPHRYTLCVTVETRYALDLPPHPAVRVVTIDGPVQTLRRLLGLTRFRHLVGDVALSLVGYIHPELMSRPYVVVVLDIQHEYRPEFFSPSELIERQYLFTKSIRHAAHVCALSEFTRRTLVERYSLPPEHVTRVYPAPDRVFDPGSPWRGRTREVLTRYGLAAGTYLFYPANTWPHKNHVTLLQALHILKARHGKAPLLVCTGRPQAAHAHFLRTARELGLVDDVRWLGYCPRTDMPALYEGARALVYPSLFEGFGLPLLEAMNCGCPVICSATTSLPETAGDAALTVDPLDPEAWAEAIDRVLTDMDLRDTLIERGRRRAAQFSWTQFTMTLLQVLERAGTAPEGRVGRPPSGSSHEDFARPRREAASRPRRLSGIARALRKVLTGTVYPRLQASGRAGRSLLLKTFNRWTPLPSQTRRLLDHPEPWWDGWAGPRLVLHRRTDRPAGVLRIQGRRAPWDPDTPLVLTVAVDGASVARHSIVHVEPFELRVELPHPLPPGLHVVTIRAHPWWIPHRQTRNGDFRPLAWQVREISLE